MSISNKIEEIMIDRNTIRAKMMVAGQATKNDDLHALATNLTIINTSDATATANDILEGKTAYSDGQKITGVLVPSTGPDTSDATATAGDIVSGKTAYAKGSKLTGTNTNDADTTAVTSGEEDLEEGVSELAENALYFQYTYTSAPDTTDATAKSNDILSGKTAYARRVKLTGTCTYDADTSDADATADDIRNGKTAYVDGVKLTGTLTPSSGVDPSDATATAADILTGHTAYIATGKVNGSMENRGALTVNAEVNGQYSHQAGYYSGITVNGPTLDGNAVISKVVDGYTFYSDSGTKLTGTMPIVEKQDMIINEATTFTAGYYPNQFVVTPSGGSGQMTETILWTNPSPSSEWTEENSVPLDTSTQNIGINNFDIIRLDFKISTSDDSYISSYYNPASLLTDYTYNTTQNLIAVSMRKPSDFPSGKGAGYISCIRRLYFATNYSFVTEKCCCTEMYWAADGAWVATLPVNTYCIPYRFVGLKVS